MAKRSVSNETFGEAADLEQIGPLSYQLNGQGTPQHLKDTIPSGDGEANSPIPDPFGLCSGSKGKGK